MNMFENQTENQSAVPAEAGLKPETKSYLETRESYDDITNFDKTEINQQLIEDLNAGPSSEKIKTKWENLDQLSEQIGDRIYAEFLNSIDDKIPPSMADYLKTKIIPQIKEVIVENKDLISEKISDKTGQKLEDLINNIKNNIPKDYSELLNEINLESFKDPEQRGRVVKISSWLIDLIPIIGGTKMILESAKGKTLGGEKINGWKRFLHGIEGSAYLFLDLSGVGEIAKLEKVVSPSAKLVTRGAALMRKSGISREVSSTVFKTGKFIGQHPVLSKFLDKKVTNFVSLRHKMKNA